MVIKDLVVTGLCKIIRAINAEQLVIESINGISKNELSQLSGVTENIQNQMSAINSKISEAQIEQNEWKSDVADAINDIPNPDNEEGISSTANKEGFIQTLGRIGTAIKTVTVDAEDVVSPKKFINDKGEILVGSMTERAAYTSAVNTQWNSDTSEIMVRIPTGAYRQSTVSGNPEIRVSPEQYNAALGLTEDKILSGKTIGSVNGTATDDGTILSSKYLPNGIIGYSKGVKYVGSIPIRNDPKMGAPGVVSLNTGGWVGVAVSCLDKVSEVWHIQTNSDGIKRLCLQAPGGIYGGHNGVCGWHGGDGYVGFKMEKFGDVSSEFVLAGKTFTSKNVDSLATAGTMKNHIGTPDHITDIRIANNRFEVAVHKGYHGYSWANNAYEYMEYNQVASTIGLTSTKLITGQTVCGVTGNGGGEEYYIPNLGNMGYTGTNYNSIMVSLLNNYCIINLPSDIMNALRRKPRYIILQNNSYDTDEFHRMVGYSEEYNGVIAGNLHKSGWSGYSSIIVNDIVMSLLDDCYLNVGTVIRNLKINDGNSDFIAYGWISGGHSDCIGETYDFQLVFLVSKSSNHVRIVVNHAEYDYDYLLFNRVYTSMRVIM